MPLERTREHLLKLTVSNEEYMRAKHHSRRLGWPVTEITARGLHAELNRLDEQQLYSAQARAQRRGIKIGAVPIVSDGDDAPAANAPADGARHGVLPLPPLPGGIRPRAVYLVKDEAPKNVEDQIPRWVNYISKADGAIDRVMRVQHVHDAMKERGATEEQRQMVMEKINEKLALREPPPRVVSAADGVPISGDVD